MEWPWYLFIAAGLAFFTYSVAAAIATQKGAPPMTSSKAQVLTGTVEATNERGVKIAGDWLNYSQWAEVDQPEKGDQVEATYTLSADGGTRWLRGLRQLSSSDASQAPAEATPQPRHSNGGELSQRDYLNARMSALKTAGRLAQAKPDANCGRVLAAAELFNRWLLGELSGEQVEQLAGLKRTKAEQKPLPAEAPATGGPTANEPIPF